MFKLSRHFDNCPILACGQQNDLLMQLDEQNVKYRVNSLTFAMETNTLQRYLKIQLTERTLIACSLAGKNMGPGE